MNREQNKKTLVKILKSGKYNVVHIMRFIEDVHFELTGKLARGEYDVLPINVAKYFFAEESMCSPNSLYTFIRTRNGEYLSNVCKCKGLQETIKVIEDMP